MENGIGPLLPAPSVRTLFGCGLAVYTKGGMSDTGLDRLLKIIMSESARTIWKLRFERRMYRKGKMTCNLESYTFHDSDRSRTTESSLGHEREPLHHQTGADNFLWYLARRVATTERVSLPKVEEGNSRAPIP